MPVGKAFIRQRQGVGILRKGARVPAPDRAGELVENDDQRQPPMRIQRPVIEPASGRLFGEAGKVRHDLVIGGALHAPVPMRLMRRCFNTQCMAFGKPEIEDVVPIPALFDRVHFHSRNSASFPIT